MTLSPFYAAQGHEISAKHLEIIVRQMFSRVMIDEAGDSIFVSGDIVSKAAIIAENQRLEAAGKEPATYENLLLGITKVSIWSDSFLSAASFQDTTRVLINAAINGRVDRLNGFERKRHYWSQDSSWYWCQTTSSGVGRRGRGCARQ